jgi:hypothetical protein
VDSQVYPTQKLARVVRSVYMRNFWYGGGFVTTVLCKSCQVPPSVAPWYAKFPLVPTRMIRHCQFLSRSGAKKQAYPSAASRTKRAGRLSSEIAGTRGTDQEAWRDKATRTIICWNTPRWIKGEHGDQCVAIRWSCKFGNSRLRTQLLLQFSSGA